MANLSNTVTMARVPAMLRAAGIKATPAQIRAALNMDPDILIQRLAVRIAEAEAKMPGNGTPRHRG